MSNGPFGSRECAIALAEICEGHRSEEACRLEPTFPFEVSSVQCGWSQVVTFAEPASCSGTSVQGKCFAQFVAPEPDGCTESCGSLLAVESDGSLIDVSCGGDGALLEGIVSESTPIDSDVPSLVQGCATASPPLALCNCSAQACQALQ